jgi:ferredoxin
MDKRNRNPVNFFSSMNGADMYKMQFKLNAAACVGCGACVRDCPIHILTLGPDAKPAVKAGKEDSCIHCQHCLAVCPKAAISVCGKDPADSLPVAGMDVPSAEQMKNLLYSRRSIRQYLPRDVARGLVDRLLAILANVPTGCNAQDLTFSVVYGKAQMDILRERVIETIAKAPMPPMLPRFIAVPAIAYRHGKADEFFRGAPHLLIVSAGNRSTTPNEDCVAALAYFDLLAQSFGLGTTWCGYLKMIVDAVPPVRTLLGLPPATPFYAMLFGYPAVRYARAVQRDDAARTREIRVAQDA